MFKRIVSLFLIAIVIAACGDKSKNTEDKQKPGESENALIDDALKAQLEALGYVGKEVEKPKVSARENPYENADIGGYFEGIEGTFVFLDLKTGIKLVHNSSRAETRFSPQSTFKIPNSLIGLDTGVANGPEFQIAWDKKKYPKQPHWDEFKKNGIDWERDHTLKSAFKNSCVWYYLELAKLIGEERMQKYLNAFNYGNKDISSGINGFWLGGSIKISAVEQVGFLKKFVKKELELSEQTYASALKVFERERKDDAILYAKTGGGNGIGWFVGFVARGENKYVFAFNMEGEYEKIAKRRVEISMKLLRELGVWL